MLRNFFLKTLVFAVVSVPLLARPSFASAEWVLHARVVEISDFPMAASGFIRTWVRIDVVRDGDLKRVQLLQVYLSRSQRIPVFGEHCIFRVHGERAGGFVGRSSVDTYDSIIVDEFRCGPKGKYESEILSG